MWGQDKDTNIVNKMLQTNEQKKLKKTKRDMKDDM